MKVHLLLALPHNQVLEEVDGEVVTGAQVCLDVHGEEDIDLSLGAKLGCKGGGGHCCLDGKTILHEGNLFTLIL